MKFDVYGVIRASNPGIRRDLQREAQWSHERYAGQVDEALNYHVGEAFVSPYMRVQISKAMHQGYWVVNDIPFACPVRSVFEIMEGIVGGGKHRGRLKSVSGMVGFEVLHAHCGQTSCITENWERYARRTKLHENEANAESMYQSLISSVSSDSRTGEWVVFSKDRDGYQFWCVWLHRAGDSELGKAINNQNE